MNWTEMPMGKRLKMALQMLDIAPEQAADRAGISVSSIWGIQSGRNQGRVKLLRQICDRLNIRICWLIEGEGDPFKLPTVRVPETTKTGTPEGVPAMRRAPSESVTPAVAPRSRRRDVQQP